MPAKRHCVTEETKRHPNNVEDKLVQKRAKVGTVDPTQDALSLVISALDQAVDVSDTGREMLRRVARGGFGTVADERHAYQAMAARMLWDVLVSVEARLSLEADNIARRVEEEKSTILQRRSELSSARAALTMHTNALDAAMGKFCEHNLAMQAARQRLDVAHETRMRADTERQKLTEMQSTLEAALRDQYTPLAEGVPDTTGKGLNTLLSVLKGTSIENSLIDAFAIAAKIEPSKRGTFDRAAVTQLGHELAKHIAALSSTGVTNADSTQIYIASEVEAEEAFKAAQKQQTESAAALRAAEIELREIDAIERRTVDITNEANNILSGLKSAHATAECKLEEFRRGPFAALEALLARHQAAVQTPSTAPTIPLQTRESQNDADHVDVSNEQVPNSTPVLEELHSLPTIDIAEKASNGNETPALPARGQETISEVLDAAEGWSNNPQTQREIREQTSIIPTDELVETAVDTKVTLETVPVATTATESMQVLPTPVRVSATTETSK